MFTIIPVSVWRVVVVDEKLSGTTEQVVAPQFAKHESGMDLCRYCVLPRWVTIGNDSVNSLSFLVLSQMFFGKTTEGLTCQSKAIKGGITSTKDDFEQHFA